MIAHTMKHQFTSYMFPLLPCIFTKKGKPGSMKLLMDTKSLCFNCKLFCFNQVLGPPYAVSHTHKRAPCKATYVLASSLWMILLLMQKCVQ